MVAHTYTLTAEAGGLLKFEPSLVYVVNSKLSGATETCIKQDKAKHLGGGQIRLQRPPPIQLC